MKRREFITLLGGAAAWPGSVWAQQPKRMPLVGVLMGTTDNAEARSRITACGNSPESIRHRRGS
jgi:hypothetical protein